MRRIPPLGALRAFEAGARHLSFTRAATELRVTQAAISHQVRQLEDWLGVSLFERRGHALTLTQKGQAYLRELTPAFEHLAEATTRLYEAQPGPLRLTVLPSLAACWLVPRLASLRERHEALELQISSAGELWDFLDDRFDVGLRSGLGKWTGLKAELLAPEGLTPVCTPALARRLRSPSDLRKLRLLHDTPKDGWRRWLDAAGVEGVDTTKGFAFNDAGLVLQAARQGEGVALGRLMLAAEDLRTGRLVRPFETVLPNDYGYWLVHPRPLSGRSDVATLRAWLRSEARATARFVGLAVTG
ncbi:transcriptional regulator GcvA [Myxococcus sp. MISCRS1]|uniref:transcriptional regulator GcvA n=1 Tax=unclassified Myxococcus TaxID=2648731 RepID=UPI001CC0CD67|nr:MULTISPECIES: transcriptional regulator GcvA [unclassified Myxococcus]MBZ4399867.1 transcriptional regulator GcvA [Myxococcus sp. AS-1-15]MCY0997634.1 transcriptional regulator GcvA [Myxococcus sp. MISCRS1]BDT32348.1 transcriptional regulator GcvA [Myxococcus sp. MH1]